MYTKIQFGKDLKERVKKRQSLVEIARWAYLIFLDRDVEGFDDVLLGLDTMEIGSEFELSYEKLDQIADDFITGKGYKWPTVDPNVPYNNRSLENRKLYTKIEFGKDLKERIEAKQSLNEIAEWAYLVSLDYDVEGFRSLLIRLNTMEIGSEFHLTYEELNKIADDLISGKDIK